MSQVSVQLYAQKHTYQHVVLINTHNWMDTQTHTHHLIELTTTSNSVYFAQSTTRELPQSIKQFLFIAHAC